MPIAELSCAESAELLNINQKFRIGLHTLSTRLRLSVAGVLVDAIRSKAKAPFMSVTLTELQKNPISLFRTRFKPLLKAH